uniref:Phorbol-ester/DAG-type domain-containing protein n=1 Tax=Macrostomum lignano TaxID=282301 RepID=A0A1I8JP03_9PLAT
REIRVLKTANKRVVAVLLAAVGLIDDLVFDSHDVQVCAPAAVSAGLRRQFNLGDAPDSPRVDQPDEQLSREQAQFGMLPDVIRPPEPGVHHRCEPSSRAAPSLHPVPIPGAGRHLRARNRRLATSSRTMRRYIDGNGSGADVDSAVRVGVRPSSTRPVRSCRVAKTRVRTRSSSLSLVGSPSKQWQQPQDSRKQRTAGRRSAYLSDSTMCSAVKTVCCSSTRPLNNWRRCLQCLQLKDAHCGYLSPARPRIPVGLANGSLLVFCRRQLDSNAATAMEQQQQQCWDLSRYYELAVSDAAHPFVRWRHSRRRAFQVLGTSRLGFSLVRLTSLFAACGRLWIGTSNGIIVTGAVCHATGFPALLASASLLPPGTISRDKDCPHCAAAISGGEGYIDFRVGDPEDPYPSRTSPLWI